MATTTPSNSPVQFGFNQYITIEKPSINKEISVSIGFSKNGYVKKDGRLLIIYKLYRNKRYVEISTGLYSYSTNIPDDVRVQLTTNAHKIEMDILSISNRHQVSLKEIKILIAKHQVKTAKFSDFGRAYIAQSNRAEGTKYNYNGIFKDVEAFQPNLLLTDFTYELGQRYISYLEEKGKTPNQISTRIRAIKTILSAAEKHMNIESSTFHGLEIIGTTKTIKNVYLSSGDLKKAENYNFIDESKQLVLDSFLLSVYSGLRFVDVKSLKSSEIVNGWIEKIVQKNKKKVSIPVNKLFNGKFLKLVEKYGCIENMVSKMGQNGAFNRKLHECLDEIGISSPNGKITYHSARHTFATLLLENGVEPVSIQHMLGHSSLSITMSIYAAVTKKTIMNGIKKAKNQ